MTRFRWIFVAPLMFVLVGCIKTRHEEEKTGLFENDFDKMLAAFEQVEQNKTTRADLEGIGFLANAPNVKHLPGAEGMKEIFGEQCFDTALRDKNNIQPLLEELSHYEMVIVPFKNIIEEKDRIYFSTQETDTEGKDASLLFVIKDDLVVYKTKRIINIDKHESEHAFAEGVLSFLEKFGGGIGKLYDLIKKLKP